MSELVFYTNPQSRGRIAHWMLEELGQPYRTVWLNYGPEMKSADYRAVNPMGKVPAVLHGDALITEQGAVFIYLADLFPQAGLAPGLADPQRGPYLRWLVYYGSSFEPALVDRAMKHAPATPSLCPYGDYDTMLKTLCDQLERGPYLLGERFSAADLLWGTALTWTTAFGLVPPLPVIQAYMDRVNARPAVARVRELDAKLSAEHAASAP